MNATQAGRLRVLENCLSAVAGVPVEITIRAENRFTSSIAERNDAAADKLVRFANECPSYLGAKVDVHHDNDAGSFVYVEVEA